MEVIIISKEKVKPSTPTPPHLRNHKQSLLDQLAVPASFTITLFYKTSSAENMSHLKNALSETLTQFYPLAGKLGKGSVIVDCNDNGVLYVEARVKARLTEFLEHPDLSQMSEFIPLSRGSYFDIETLERLVSVQVTRFDCGGVVIGAAFCHKVLDASTMSAFLNTWAKIAREGVNSIKTMSLDYTTPSLLFPAQNPLPIEFPTFLKSLFLDEGEFVMRRFMFDAKAIADIKVKAASESVPNPTRVEALTAFIWKHMLLATRAVKGKSSPCMLTHAVNLRSRLNPPLPNACGNLLWLATTFYEPETSHEIELSHLVVIIREMFDSVKGENLKVLEGDGAFNYTKDLATDAGNLFSEVDTYRFTSWCRFGLYDVDFGWGKPTWIAPVVDPVGSLNKQGVVLVESGWNDANIEVWTLRNMEEMFELENDKEFMAYASPNPSVDVP